LRKGDGRPNSLKRSEEVMPYEGVIAVRKGFRNPMDKEV
jgi:hypothetical protein